MLTVDTLLNHLTRNSGAALHMMLPDGSFVPSHFHVTEVGRVQKDFIDCGGTVRSSTSCLLQVWVATDLDHRLNATKLAKILQLGAPLLKSNDLPVEIEYEGEVISQYPLMDVEITPSGLLLNLGNKHTACLATDACGVNLAASNPNAKSDCGCGPAGCC